MADWRPDSNPNGLRVLPYYDGTSDHAWRIDMRFSGRVFGIDVESQQFANDSALSVSLYKLNRRLSAEGCEREVAIEDVRRLEAAHG